MPDNLEEDSNVFPVFSFSCTKYHINVIKSFLQPLFVNERQIEPIGIKKVFRFESFIFGDVQLIDRLNFLIGTTSLDSSPEAYNTLKTEEFFPPQYFDIPETLNNTQLLPHEAFNNKLRKKTVVEKSFPDFQGLIDGGMTSKEAPFHNFTFVSHLQLCRKSFNSWSVCVVGTGANVYPQKLFWHYKMVVAPTLHTIQKMVDSYRNKILDMVRQW